MTNEIWKDININGFEGLYAISNNGDVLSRRTGKILKQAINGCGYKFVVLCNHGNIKIIRIHRILAEYFIPNPHNYEFVNHKDEDKSNNSLKNLEWCTRSYNNTYGTFNKRRQDTRNRKMLKNAEKPILQFDKSMNLIAEHKSICSCGYDRRNVVNVLKGKNKTAYGFIWKYKNS